MSNTILTKYSATTSWPASLQPGELAWSKATQSLYIGEDDGSITKVNTASTGTTNTKILGSVRAQFLARMEK